MGSRGRASLRSRTGLTRGIGSSWSFGSSLLGVLGYKPLPWFQGSDAETASLAQTLLSPMQRLKLEGAGRGGGAKNSPRSQRRNLALGLLLQLLSKRTCRGLLPVAEAHKMTNACHWDPGPAPDRMSGGRQRCP